MNDSGHSEVAQRPSDLQIAESVVTVSMEALVFLNGGAVTL